jgi:hypothetical protein
MLVRFSQRFDEPREFPLLARIPQKWAPVL